MKKWVIDECDTTDAVPSYAYIDFHCPTCESEFGLEQGQYGWCLGEEIPYQYCPMCGERLYTYQKSDEEEWDEDEEI